MTTPKSLVTVDREILSGTPVFTGTRVPIQNLFDYLAAGDSLEEFLEDFPGVTREHAMKVLRDAGEVYVTVNHANID